MTTHSMQADQPASWKAVGKAVAQALSPPALASPGDRKGVQFMRLYRARLVHALAIVIAVRASELLGIYPVLDNPTFHELTSISLDLLMVWIAVPAALSAAQVWLPNRRLRLLAMAVAVLAISAAQASFYTGWRPAGPLLNPDRSGLMLYNFWLSTVIASLLAIAYERQMGADRVTAAVRATRIADEAIEHQTLESRLNSLKARVDPEFLFAVIERSEALYQQDMDAAEGLMDQLIDFLRASLPQQHDPQATLGKEMQLCAAYLAIEAQLRNNALHCDTASDAMAADSKFPTSVLLLLVQSLLPSRVETDPHHVSITAENLLSCVRVELRCTGAAASPQSADASQALDSASAALRSFFGDAARIDGRPAWPAAGHTILIEVPHGSL